LTIHATTPVVLIVGSAARMWTARCCTSSAPFGGNATLRRHYGTCWLLVRGSLMRLSYDAGRVG
jgi:hypothetical protein